MRRLWKRLTKGRCRYCGRTADVLVHPEVGRVCDVHVAAGLEELAWYRLVADAATATMTAATLPGLHRQGLYRDDGWVVYIDRGGGRWVWAGDTLGTPGTKFGLRPVIDGRVTIEEADDG